MSLEAILIAIAGGIFPALIWLWYWRHEDRRRPEPRGRIALTFFLGMLAVIVAIPLEKSIESTFGLYPLLVMILWSLVEEVVKFVAAYISALRTRIVDEPIDAVIYMITAALGFTALENALFILSPLTGGFVLEGLITGNMRFLGATVLHTLASGVIGAFIGFSFYKKRAIKRRYAYAGLALAVGLHALYNFFIMNGTQQGIFVVFAVIWAAIIVLLFIFEKVKAVRPFRRK